VESSSRPPHPPRCSPRPTPTRRGRCRGGQQPPIMSNAEQTASARTPAQHERCRAGAACQRPPPASFSHLPRAGLEQVDPGLGPPDPGQGGRIWRTRPPCSSPAALCRCCGFVEDRGGRGAAGEERSANRAGLLAAPSLAAAAAPDGSSDGRGGGGRRAFWWAALVALASPRERDDRGWAVRLGMILMLFKLCSSINVKNTNSHHVGSQYGFGS
jgi:hypothetical protein